jgi:hypothetical protein
MKLTYDTKPDERECVAYISGDGGLVIKERRGNHVYMVYDSFDPSDATHRFYPGDSITITFE